MLLVSTKVIPEQLSVAFLFPIQRIIGRICITEQSRELVQAKCLPIGWQVCKDLPGQLRLLDRTDGLEGRRHHREKTT